MFTCSILLNEEPKYTKKPEQGEPFICHHPSGYKSTWNVHIEDLLILQYWDAFLKKPIAKNICLLNQHFEANNDTIISQN